MRQIAVRRPGGPEVLYVEDAPVPEPGRGEVLIKVAAAGVNRPDILQREGRYAPPPGASPILGLEVAGTIAACGEDVTDWRVGDTVCALLAGGGYAEFCVAPVPQCLPVPPGLSFIEAAALPETFFTVWTNVFERGRLIAGETILIHGGASGIGTTAIQLARAFGARVVTTAGSDAKCDACRRLGADVALNYRTSDWGTDAGPVNVILDMVGAPYFVRNLTLLGLDGRLVSIAHLEGSRVEFDMRPIMVKRLTITASMLRPRTVAEKGAIAGALLANVWPLLERGEVRPVIDATYPLADVADAHRRMDSAEHIGKVVLTI
jgi:putative PIG3 family NAD(P)H quinone oxidoreductase